MSLLRQLFGRFLQSRRVGHFFRSRILFETLPAHTAARAMPADLAQRLNQDATQELNALLARLQTSAQGQDRTQADAVRARVGPNEVNHEKPMPWWRHLWLAYKNPFNLLLSSLAILSWMTSDDRAAVVIACMVTLSTALRFGQERRSNRAAQRLKDMVSHNASVLRPAPAPQVPQAAAIAARLLVPGDVVALSAGDMIPADCRVLGARDLFVSQSAMTGESLPVEKFPRPDAADPPPLERQNLLFMGTNVVSGTATALVLSTGNHTYFGTLTARATSDSHGANAFQAGVNQVSWLLIRFALVMVPLVLLINGWTKGQWAEAFLFSLSIAVGLTPEMLPMIVTSTLAIGAVQLSHKKVIVKRLDAIQNFGAMNVLCTDKTGTLTQDKIALARHTDVFGAESDRVLELAYLNSYYQTGLKNLLDHAVLEHSEVHTQLDVERNYQKIDEIPFDFTRRRMSVVVAERDHRHVLICKGAVEEIMAACARMRSSEQEGPLDAPVLERVRTVTRSLNESGLRVVAVAVKELPPDQQVYTVADESGLTLVGYIAFLDPPKESTAPALRALADNGVGIKVLTGDNELVSAEVCRQVGLTVHGVVLGTHIDAMDDPTLSRAVEANTLFAKLSPLNKERIVRALRANGDVVGFMGDGINDAAALHAADIGISVDSAVDIAKEAADIILLERSLLVLAEGVREGRKTFGNMLKYIHMTASSNFGNVLSVLVASVALPFLPMLPLQLLVQNLLYDLAQTAIPFDNVDADRLRFPLAWNPSEIGRFMLFFGPISSVFDIATFLVLWFVLGANTPDQAGLFQSGWFVVGLLTQTLVVHMIRTPKLPFIASRAAWPLMLSTVLTMVVGILLPMGPLAEHFGLQPLPARFFPWLVAILLSYVLTATLMKRLYIRRFGWH